MNNTNMDPSGVPKGQGPAGYQRSASSDAAEQFNHPSGNMKAGPPPAYARGYYPHYPNSRPPNPIQSVVTTSFSMEEEREDGSGRHRSFRQPEFHMESRDAFEPPHAGREPPHYGREHELGRELPPIKEGEFEHRAPQPDGRRTVRVPPSPRGLAPNEHPPIIHRSHSAGSYRGQGPLKRSFWHHARSGEEYQNSLPHEFMPPKRSKVSSTGRREYVVTARPPSDEYSPRERYSPSAQRSPGWFNRSMSWEASREEYYRREPSRMYQEGGSWSRSPPYREGGPQSHWSDAPDMPSPRTRFEGGPGPYNYDSWAPRYKRYEEGAWMGSQNRDEDESKHMKDFHEREGYAGDMRRQRTFDSLPDGEPPMRFIGGPVGPPRTISSTNPNMDRKKGPVRLLALPEDRISLSETLCLVRENIEVFTATVEDVEAPAPGRKHAVSVGQVGLRCIHCRHTTRSSDRVKRAVCYPSSIKRIYRTVIDMKLDHFINCKFVPESLKETLNALKANNTRSTGTTMQYFMRAAGILGMIDGPSGVRLSTPAAENPNGEPSAEEEQSAKFSPKDNPDSHKQAKANTELSINRTNSLSSNGSNGSGGAVDESAVPTELFTGKIPLAMPEDKMSLSPLRCFLREQVCAFSASEEDIAVRTPTTFSVSVGQVGIGCIHCLSQPAKMRLNRAVCFPFSIARIYQSVADIQRFHLGECKMVPSDVKATFLELQSQSSKGSKGLATRQYWVTSAKKIGLVDTPKGIRFGRDPTEPEAKPVSLDILAQVASNVTTVNRPLVLPEDKPFIAEFLYLVMEQLQPCRFTEADRNKRRLKDVGCIGVECKHCAGTVDGRKFFWSSVNAVESNFVSVHTHMMECKQIPAPLKDKLSDLKKLRKEQTALLKTGSQKAFFSRVWKRLHGDGGENKAKVDEATGEMDEGVEAQESENQKFSETIDTGAGAPKNLDGDGDSKMPASTVAGDSDAKMDSPPTSPKKLEAEEEPAMETPPAAAAVDTDSKMLSPPATPTKKKDVTDPVMETPNPPSPSSEQLKSVNDKMAVVSV